MSADSLVDDFYLDVDDNNHEIVADAEIKVQAASDRTDSTQSTVDIKKRKYGDKQQQPVMNKKPAIEIPPPLILSSASDIQQHIWDAYSYDQKRKWTEIERADAEKIYRIPLEAIRVPDESKFKRRPVQSSGDDFNEFLRSVFDLKSLKRPIKNRGKPRVVVICNSAIRCTEIIK
jgi:hypothetical protein